MPHNPPPNVRRTDVPGPVPDGYDLTNPDIYAEKVPLEEFSWLRRSAPAFWNAQTVEDSSFETLADRIATLPKTQRADP